MTIEPRDYSLACLLAPFTHLHLTFFFVSTLSSRHLHFIFVSTLSSHHLYFLFVSPIFNRDVPFALWDERFRNISPMVCPIANRFNSCVGDRARGPPTRRIHYRQTTIQGSYSIVRSRCFIRSLQSHCPLTRSPTSITHLLAPHRLTVRLFTSITPLTHVLAPHHSFDHPLNHKRTSRK